MGKLFKRHLKRRSRKPSEWQNKNFCIAFGITISILEILLITSLFSVAMTFIDIKPNLIRVTNYIAMAAGVYSGAFIAGYKFRRDGLQIGLYLSLAINMFMIMCSLLFLRSADTGYFIVRFVVTLVFACAGGVTGVNTKYKV